MNTLYTIGYTGRSLDELADIAKAHAAGIVDIRFSAWSREPKWRKADLAKSMEHRGVAYTHIRELGNINYDSPKPIEIARPDEGCAALAVLLKHRPQILLCACEDVERCHRSVVAGMMQERYGVEVVHLGKRPKAEEPSGIQGDLFS